MDVNVDVVAYRSVTFTWRKIQQLGLTELYKSDEVVKQFCGMLDALAFLPPAEVATSK